MNVMQITPESTVDGEGMRVVLFVSGCRIECKGCHNPQSHDFNNGVLFTENTMQELIDLLGKPYISGITLSGGHPLETQNADDVLEIVKRVKTIFPNKDVWIYSGYVWEIIMTNPKLVEIMKYCDVLVDGAYIDELRDLTLQFRGSSNQRLIDVQKSLTENKVVLWQSN